MRAATPHLVLALLIALLIGHASVAVHAASHVASDFAECKLCISYGDSSEALDSVPEQGVRAVLAEPVTLAASAATFSRRILPYFQRGPPISN